MSIPLSRAPALCSWRTAQLSLAAGGRSLSSSAPARVVCPAQGVDAVGLRQHALGGDLGPGVDLRIHAGDIVQRLAGDLPGAQFAIVQRTLEIGNGKVLKSHALYTPAISSRGPRG